MLLNPSRRRQWINTVRYTLCFTNVKQDVGRWNNLFKEGFRIRALWAGAEKIMNSQNQELSVTLPILIVSQNLHGGRGGTGAEDGCK